ncbi:hypothetical protein HO133_000895 [Letharia lupina]|uniref:Uncharacterized protein n=1 Tax=Letharia lupina TaxID=560253 RepID=A0A8H6FCI8_9LECA|nr:uncharacterized protein HO133_000895 [Letharia lupina]KAF6222844.1 hypothetical protein HO133_000895 [Letharia lupina]
MAPGGAWHAPLFVPYALYGRVDRLYGAGAWEARNGFTGAQAGLNVVESVGYAAYLWVVWRYGEEDDGGKRVVGGGYMAYEFARDILHGLSIASGDRSSKPARAATPTKEE